MSRSVDVLILGQVWPEPRSSAAGSRSLDLIEALRGAGHEVHFASAGAEGEHRAALEASGVRTHVVRPNDPAFDAWISELRPAMVVFERFMIEEQYGWRVREHSPGSARVLDTVDLHFLRRARQASLIDGVALSLQGPDLWRELAAIHRSDLTLVVSSEEMRLLQEDFGVAGSRLHHFPLVSRRVPDAAIPEAAFRERSGFAVVGNFRHPPNLDGVLWLAREIWPRVRERLPAAELRVYGAYPARQATELHDPRRGFLVEGWVEDSVAALARARVNLAPLRFGAGLKGKIMDGWRAGTPCVSTPVGAEGMGEADDWGGLVADDAECLAAAAVRLHEDEALWRSRASRGRELLNGLFDFNAQSGALVARLAELLSRLADERAGNVIGSMLWHHTLASTRHLSRWIELKNEKRGTP